MPAQTTETHTTLTPDTPVRYLKGVGPKTAERFEKLGIVTLADLLCHYPRRYMDFSKPYSIAEAPCDTECVVKAEVFAKPGGRILPGGRRMERITAGDDVSSLEITWFNNPYAAQKLELGQAYYFQGIVTGGMLRRQMVNPQVRTEAQITAAPFEAVYPQTDGLSSSVIARCVRQLLPHAELLPDPLPPEMRQKYRLLSKAEAVRAIHCPATEEQAYAARRRLIYEELLVLQLGIGRMKNRGAAATGAPMQLADPSPFWASLPFSPTGAQRRAVSEILADMAGETSMNRLLQGDVGSGKTLVAAAAIWACIRAGYQAALLAPTEILATQHAEGLNRMLAPFGMRVALLTGGMKAAARRTTLAAIRNDEADLVVGTHAILSEGVEFARLGLAVIDEQHRFGVRQRGMLAEKAANPHLLVMSATPIPRTLGLLIYGDLDISILDELPPGREPVDTFLVGESYRPRINAFIRKQVAGGHQCFVVCPAVEENEELGIKAASVWAETLQQTVNDQGENLQLLQQTVTAQSQKITDLEQQVQALSGAKAYWQGKKWVAFGDSISAGFQLDDPDTQLYSQLIAKDLGLQLISGSMHAMNSMGYTVTAGTAVGQHSMPAYVNADKNKDADLVTIFAGTNDFGRSVAMPLGTMADDANTESFYGRLKLTCDLLSAKYPNALVILLTPLPRHDCEDGTKGTVEPTKTLVDYADAIRQVAALYSFPVLDLTRESGMQMRSKTFRTAYMADNIHPNAAGHAKFIAPALERFILQHTPVM